MEYQIPSRKELIELVNNNWNSERYDGIHSSFHLVPRSHNFILMIDSTDPERFDGEWVKVNGGWERPDGSVPLYARALNCGKLAP